MPFEDFEKKFALGQTSTEQNHPITRQLSQVMHESVARGMGLLVKVDEGILQGFESFLPTIHKLAPALSEKRRIFLVGSGSSGRVAIDIAAKCKNSTPSIIAIIAGGDSAIVKAREGFEDSETAGEEALREYHIGADDAVILISASGSAPFNVGCGQFSANAGACVFYFYNSTSIPLRTQNLFTRDENPVIPLCVDIGPQAIGGSTRLQGATLAEACLGALLTDALRHTPFQKPDGYPEKLLDQLQKGAEIVYGHINSIQKFSLIEQAVFSNPNSNFRRLTDTSEQGYVTIIATEDSLREVLIDATEISPTFSTSPIRRVDEEGKKKEEFRAYAIGQRDNRMAWASLLGRDPHPQEGTESFLLTCNGRGATSFSERPKGKGNFLIGVAKVESSATVPQELIDLLDDEKRRGGSVGLILICSGNVPKTFDSYDCVLTLENLPADVMGFAQTIILKQVLNLISNSTMVLMEKVLGNQMIDVQASNMKLVDRCIRLIGSNWPEPCSREVLYHYVSWVAAIKKAYAEKGIYSPSAVKIVLAMLALKKTPADFQEVVAFLLENQERLDFMSQRITNSTSPSA